MGGATPHKGPEQQLAGNLRGREVEDGDNVGLGQEVDQAGHLLLQAVACQVQVGEGVEGQLVGDERLAQVVHAFASEGAVGQVDVPEKGKNNHQCIILGLFLEKYLVPLGK